MVALFSADDVGALLKISSPTAYRIARAANVATVKQGKKRGFTRDAVHEIIDAAPDVPDDQRSYFKKLASQGHPAVKRAVAARRWLSTTEVACLLSTSRNTVIRWQEAGAITPSFAVGRQSAVFDVKDVAAYAVQAGLGVEWAS